MNAAVVTRDGKLHCSHTGARSLKDLAEQAAVKLTVADSHVVTVQDAGGSGEYTGCTVKDSNGNAHPCNSTAVASAGGKLTAGGRAVLLTTDTVTSANDLGVPPLTVTPASGQDPTRLTAAPKATP